MIQQDLRCYKNVVCESKQLKSGHKYRSRCTLSLCGKYLGTGKLQDLEWKQMISKFLQIEYDPGVIDMKVCKAPQTPHNSNSTYNKNAAYELDDDEDFKDLGYS